MTSHVILKYLSDYANTQILDQYMYTYLVVSLLYVLLASIFGYPKNLIVILFIV